MSLLPVSACIIARDEEDNIADAVRSVDFVSEIVVVLDSRSTDRTPERAANAVGEPQRLKVVRRDWAGHVRQKNSALDQASEEWVLCLDADERVSGELRDQLVGLFAGSPRHDGYAFSRKTYYIGRWIRHGGWYPDTKLRLFRKASGRWGGVDPHDRVLLDGTQGLLHGDLLHTSYRSIRDHIRKIELYASIAATEMRARGVRRPVARMVVHPVAKFLKMYLLRRGFLDGYAGMVVALLGSFSVFLKYARLWEMIEVERRARRTGAVPLGGEGTFDRATHGNPDGAD